MIMDRRQLPLHALRAFEVTARRLSMRAAAEELGVTHGAISHQIRALEGSLQLALFERQHNRLVLTDEGQRYYRQLNRFFEELLLATRTLSPESLSGALSIGCSLDSASNWLVPALDGFMVLYPEIELHVIEIKPGQQIPVRAEVGVALGMPTTALHDVVPLVRPRFYPVCSPALIAGAPRRIGIKQISQLRLLHVDDGTLWREWQLYEGLENEIPAGGIYLPSNVSVLSAARKGLGVALAQQLEVEDDLNSGQLIRLSESSISSPDSYYLFSLKPPALTNRALLFKQWIQQRVGSPAP